MATKKPKEEVRVIKIFSKDDEVSMVVTGFTELEVLGLLRLYEQNQSIDILRKFKK